MSDITLQFDPTLLQTQVVVDQNTIQVTPAAIGLNVYTGSAPVAGGNNGALQYNNLGLLSGVPTANYISGNLFLGNSANIKINGGANAYFLQTDGTGNLTWAQGTANVSGNGTAAGANTQIQITDGTGNFVSAPGFTFDNATNVCSIPGDLYVSGNIYGNGNTANYANFAGEAFSVNAANIVGAVPNANYASFSGTANTVTDNNQPNITSVGNLNLLNVVGNITANNANFATDLIVGSNANIGNNIFATSGQFSFISGNGYFLTYIPGGNVFGTVANANYSLYSGTVLTNAQPNITSVGTLTTLTVNGNANITGTANISQATNVGGNLTAPNIIANTGAFYGNGAGLTNITAGNISGQVSNALVAGTVYTNAQPNITSVGNLTSLTVAGTTSIQQAKEKVVASNTAATGTINFDVLNGAIQLQTANASGNFILNVRGNSTTTFSSLISDGQCLTLNFINKNGNVASAGILTNLQIDGSTVGVNWAGISGRPDSPTLSGYDQYIFSIIKQGGYVVFGTKVGTRFV